MDVPDVPNNAGTQHRPRQSNLQFGARRGLVKLALEASPLQQAQIPPCKLRSVALVNREKEEQDDRLSLYLGTDSGHLLLFTWFRSFTSTSYKAGGVNDYSGGALFLSANVSLGNSSCPVEFLCPLPQTGTIAAVLEKQVLLLDLHSLNTVDSISFNRGVCAIARAFGCTDNLQVSKGRGSSSANTEGESIASPTSSLSRRNSGQGQLGWLFGSGKLQAKRGAWNLLSIESRLTYPPTGEHQSSSEILSTKFSNMDRFAIAVKQKLFLFEVKIEHRVNKQSDQIITTAMAVKLKEFTGPEEVVTIAWIGNAVITGNFQEYTIFSVIDGSSSLLFALPKDMVSPPLLKPFPKDMEALLLMDTVGIVVNSIGQPTSSSLVFQDVPDAVGQSLSYAIVVKQGVVELYHRKTGAKVQSVLLSDNTIGPCLVADDDNGKFIAVSSAVKVYCLERVPVDEQLKELLRQRQYEEAVALAEESMGEMDVESANEKLAALHAQAGFLLFFDLQFKSAVDHFLKSSVMHPAEVFPFFPNMTERWRSMVPRNRYWGLHPPPQALQNVIENKLHSIQRGLVLQAISDVAQLQNGHSLLATPMKSKSSIVEEYAIRAIEQVIRYLKVARRKPMSPSFQEGVDTLLMKLFIKVGHTGEMEEFASSENSCIVEEVEGLLKDSMKLRTLAFLYGTKGMQSLALDVWQSLAQSNTNIAVLNDGGAQEPCKQGSLQMDAAIEAARLLKLCSDGNLVLTHLKWILKVSQKLAFEILTSSQRSVALSPDAVLLGLDPSERSVQQRYLQWLVQEQGVQDARYHTQLALSLTESAMQSLQTKFEKNATGIHANMMFHEHKEPNMLRESNNGGHEGSELDSIDLEVTSSLHNIRTRLQQFLEYSDKYDPGVVLAIIKESELWHEQAILYRKLRNELAVFQILALKLEDTEAAEQYCIELNRSDAYMRLLDMYLKPGEGREPMYSAAVHLLQLHGTSLDPLQVLEALSPDMPLQLAYETIARMFKARVHVYHQGQIVKHLSRAENLEARLSRLSHHARDARINDQTSCGSCFSRFGTKLFALYPNDSAICYKCFRNSGSSFDPVTGHNFNNDAVSSNQKSENRKDS